MKFSNASQSEIDLIVKHGQGDPPTRNIEIFKPIEQRLWILPCTCKRECSHRKDRRLRIEAWNKLHNVLIK